MIDLRTGVRLVDWISLQQKVWRNDPRIMAWTRQSHLLTDADMDAWKERIKAPDIQMFGIYANYNDAGTCGLTSINMLHRTAEFSLLIDPEQQGNGYGTVALKLLLNYGFNNLGLRLIWGEVFDGNDAARKSYSKIGFKEEAKLRERYFKNGKIIGTTIVSITREEFNDGQKTI